MLEKIVSGGQTGVDRGALDAALEAEFPAGGWCPADRTGEDGPIPACYPVTPLPRGGYRERTLRNVQDSNGTAILAPGVLSGGTLLTHALCQEHGRPVHVVDALQLTEEEAADGLARFVAAHGISTLNVAGPRASGWPAGQAYARTTLTVLLKEGCRPGLTADREGRVPPAMISPGSRRPGR